MELLNYSKQIELLEGKANWSTWKFRVGILLRGLKRAADVCEGKLVAPIAPAEDATEAVKKAYEKALETFTQSESMALHVLTSNMSRDILLMVMRFTTAREMWLELNRLFDGGDSIEKLYRVGMEFFSYSPIGDTEMASHLSKLKNQFHELNHEFEENKLPKLPEIVLIMKILNTLPEQYLPFLTSWKMINKADQTVDHLTNELCAFQSQLLKKPYQLSNESNEALAVQQARAHKPSHRQKPTKDKSNTKRRTCFYCNLPGHFVKQCQKWIADGRPSKEQQQKQVLLTPTDSTKNKGTGEALCAEMMLVDSSAFVVENDQNAWYIDNGATTHVTNCRDIFRTFEVTDSVKIKTANGDSAQAIGSGTCRR
jgi:hypothetical protein